MKLEKRLVGLFLTLKISFLVVGCSSFQIADISPGVTLPASGTCFQISVLTRKEKELPKKECDELKKRSLFITSEDWKKQRISVLKNCQMQECKQLVGAFDELFLTVDAGLQKLP